MVKRGLVLILMVGVCFFIVPHVFAATFTVNSLLDTGDSNTADNLCDIGDGSCTLRAAMEQAQATAGTDIITITANGTTSPTTPYPTMTGQTVSIIGPGVDDFIIDAAAVDQRNLFDFDTVTNGTFSGFKVINIYEVGFNIDSGSDHNTFTEFELVGRGIDTGNSLIELFEASYNEISSCALSEGGLGVRLHTNSDHNIVNNCTSTSQQHSGLTIFDSAYNTFSNNTITDSDQAGMFIIFGADHNTIEDNTITDSAVVGITMGSLGADNGVVNNNIFRRNTITGTVDGNAIEMSNTGIEDTTFVGNIIKNNNGFGISILGATGVVIGGGSIDRNVIGGNTFGIHVNDSSDVTISGNYLGLDEDGTTSLLNSYPNISIKSSSNVTIGGVDTDARNYIAGNGDISVNVMEASSDVVIANNYMGLDINGNLVGPEGGYHLFIDEGSNDIMVGGVGQGNIISGAYVGIAIGTGTDVTIQGNSIGVNTAGDPTSGYGNTGAGIIIQSSNNKIGGDPGLHEDNRIAGNGIGIMIISNGSGGPDGNSILGNSIFANTGPGIDLADVDGDDNPILGVTTNDSGDGDTGPNDYLNHPVILSAIQSGSDTVITYGLDVPVSGQPYHIEFFTNTTNGVDASGFGQGETYIDSDEQTISTSGFHVFSKTLVDVSPTDTITATVTECTDGGCTTFGSTSEFSNSVPNGIDIGTASGSETAVADGGAYHILSTAFLGACVNADDDTHTDTNGPAGSYSGESPCSNDKDGVTGLDTPFTAGDTMTAHVTASEPGYLSVWMDLDNDGSFGGADEWLINNDAITGTQDSVLPIDAPSAGTYNIRFRYTTYDHDGLLATGEALDGEVEDYVITTVGGVSENPIVTSRPITVSGGCPHDWILVNGTCQYQKTQLLEVAQILGSGMCPANLIIHDFMKDGDRNGKYSNYNKKVITEVNILQAHINRILAVQYKQAAGPVDGIFKSKTKLGVQRLQTALNQILKPVPVLKIDGIVGPYTREAINHSCG